MLVLPHVGQLKSLAIQIGCQVFAENDRHAASFRPTAPVAAMGARPRPRTPARAPPSDEDRWWPERVKVFGQRLEADLADRLPKGPLDPIRNEAPMAPVGWIVRFLEAAEHRHAAVGDACTDRGQPVQRLRNLPRATTSARRRFRGLQHDRRLHSPHLESAIPATSKRGAGDHLCQRLTS